MLEPKTFAVSNIDDTTAPPIPFTLSGVYAPEEYTSGRQATGATWSETYNALPVIPMAASASMAEAFFLDEATGRRQVNPAAVIGFIRDALPEADARRWMDLVYDKKRLIRMDVLAAVMDYLVGIYVARPTGPLSSSTPGGSGDASGAVGPLSWPVSPTA